MTRGIKNQVDQFITELQGKYFPFQWRNPETKELMMTNLQVSVRPIQLWEIVYPEEFNDIMLTTILADGKGETQHKRHNKFIFALRKILGVQPIPEYQKNQALPINKAHVEMIGIGVKKDYWTDKDGKHILNPTAEQKKEMFEGI
jgi:hypothetical protein